MTRLVTFGKTPRISFCGLWHRREWSLRHGLRNNGASIVTLARGLLGILIAGFLVPAALFIFSELINKGIVPVVSQEVQRLIVQRRY